MVDTNLNVKFQNFLEGKWEFKGDKKELLQSETKQASQKRARTIPPMANKTYAIEFVTVILELQRPLQDLRHFPWLKGWHVN
jgi:hypothetical protein